MSNSILAPNNRLDYGAALMPDEGWDTSWAIGTTYGLDLDVLMSIPLALFHRKYHCESTSEDNLKTDMLDALNKVRDRMFVFIHPNNIKYHKDHSVMMGFLDRNIWNFPVENAFQSFHPKVWLIRYEKGKDFRYRLITMSRNITSATDFDIAVTMDSRPKEKGNLNEELINMMTTLMDITSKSRTQRKSEDELKFQKRVENIKKNIKEELKQVQFIIPQPFEHKDKFFYPSHFSGDRHAPLFAEKEYCEEYSELMVISPFIDSSTLSILKNRCSKNTTPILVSRHEEIQKYEADIINDWKCYEWNTMLEDPENFDEGDSSDDASLNYGLGLHAKIYIVKTRFDYEKEARYNWFIGSTNCSKAGFGTKDNTGRLNQGNYEALVHLRTNNTDIPEIVDSLSQNQLIIPYRNDGNQVSDPRNNTSNRILKYGLYELFARNTTVVLEERECGKYSTRIACDLASWSKYIKFLENITIKIMPLAIDDVWNLNKSGVHEFQPMLCQQLSQFFRVIIEYSDDECEKFLLNLDYDIPEQRQEKIMSEILDSEEKLMKYLIFCLDYQLDIHSQKIGKNSPSNKHNENSATFNVAGCSLPIYEKLLLAISRNPKSIGEIKSVVNKLSAAKDSCGNYILSQEFKDMWNLFSEYSR